MKRTVAMLIAVLLAVAVALPVMASPYTDLPDTHWALSAVYELSALGILKAILTEPSRDRSQQRGTNWQ